MGSCDDATLYVGAVVTAHDLYEMLDGDHCFSLPFLPFARAKGTRPAPMSRGKRSQGLEKCAALSWGVPACGGSQDP